MWNFEKVLVGKDGKVVDRFRSTTGPDSKKMLKAIQSALGA
jgi:glutathione peroxidase